MSSSDDELMNPDKFRIARAKTKEGVKRMVEEDEEEEEAFEVSQTTMAPPSELVERFGDLMKSDAKRETMKFEASLGNEGKKGANGLKAPVDLNKKEKWIDAHYVDLARGVPMGAMQDDAYRIRGQNFVCLSFIFSESYDTLHCGDRLYRGDLIKVRGVFKTRENADRFIKEELLVKDPHTKVYLARCFQWTTLEDDGDDDERTRESQKEEIDQLLRGYFENENNRLSDFQRRINMVKSREKRRAKTTEEFFNETLEMKNEEHQKNSVSREIFEERVEKKEVIDLDTLKEKLDKNETIDHNPVIELSADSTRIPGQNWACVSYISPKEYKSRSYPNEGYKRPLIKIRGIFDTRQEADQFIRSKIQVIDGSTDVNLVPCFQWAGLDDDSVDEREYMGGDERCNLRELLDEYAANNNNKIYAVPQDRVREARKRQIECTRKGIRDPNKMPFDARILPDLSTNEIKAYEQLEDSDMNRPSAASDSSASMVTVMGATIKEETDEDLK